jgi:hypothetical protein
MISRSKFCRRRKYGSWKNEVKSIIVGANPTEAARVIKRIATESHGSGELGDADYSRAMDWADKLFWKKTKFVTF